MLKPFPEKTQRLQLDRRSMLTATLSGSTAFLLSPRTLLATPSSSPQPAHACHPQDRSNSTKPAQVAHGKAVAATVHPIATLAAIRMLERGGNAIDAIVAAATTLSVVDGHNSGIGGGCLILIRSADGQLTAIDGRETAGGRAHRNMFLRDGVASTSLSQTGPLAVAVPGEIAALNLAHRKFGKLFWKDLFEPSIKAAADGFAVGQDTVSSMTDELEDLRKFPASAHSLLDENKMPFKLGQTWKQPDLAWTLEQIATQGADWFYRGPFAQTVCNYLQSIGGILEFDDFQRYQAKIRDPIQTSYRNHRIIGFPPPSSGGLHIAQMLMMLERFPLQSLYLDAPDQFAHVLAEAMKLAFADRAFWLGDSDFVPVPKALIHPEYIKLLSQKIDLEKTGQVVSHHQPHVDDHSMFGDRKHTTHLTVADAQGNWVAMTATVNTSWGSKVMAPGTGVILNNQMDDFAIAPGTPNAFGLLGAEANAVAPHKRPLSSMSPTIVLNPEGNPVMTCGAAGGPRIINATLQTMIRYLDLEQPIDLALSSPRIHHQWRPDTLMFEPELDPAIIDSLKRKGHATKSIRSIAVGQAIARSRISNLGPLTAACDPRADGLASTLK